MPGRHMAGPIPIIKRVRAALTESHLGSVIGLSAASLPRCHLVACNASRWCSHQSESVNRP